MDERRPKIHYSKLISLFYSILSLNGSKESIVRSASGPSAEGP